MNKISHFSPLKTNNSAQLRTLCEKQLIEEITVIVELGESQPCFLLSQLGHVDFYPNSGKQPQPGCDKEGLDLDCSHQRAPVS